MLSKRLAALFAVLLTAGVTVVRVVLMPQLQDGDTGAFTLHPLIVGLIFGSVLLFALLILPWKVPLCPVHGTAAPFLGLLSLLSGVALLLTTVSDAWVWIQSGDAPPPSSVVISGVDRACLILTMVFGVLGGLFLVALGLRWFTHKLRPSRLFQWSALAPVLWLWFRLARYEISYSSAVSVSESFFDFVMLIFLLLFLFALARYVAGVGKPPARTLRWYSLCTGLLCLSGTLTRLCMYFMDEVAAYNSSRLSGGVDFFIGLFALGFGLYQLLHDPATDPSDELLPPEGALPEGDVGSVVLDEFAEEFVEAPVSADGETDRPAGDAGESAAQQDLPDSAPQTGGRVDE